MSLNQTVELISYIFVVVICDAGCVDDQQLFVHVFLCRSDHCLR